MVPRLVWLLGGLLLLAGLILVVIGAAFFLLTESVASTVALTDWHDDESRQLVVRIAGIDPIQYRRTRKQPVIVERFRGMDGREIVRFDVDLNRDEQKVQNELRIAVRKHMYSTGFFAVVIGLVLAVVGWTICSVISSRARRPTAPA